MQDCDMLYMRKKFFPGHEMNTSQKRSRIRSPAIWKNEIAKDVLQSKFMDAKDDQADLEDDLEFEIDEEALIQGFLELNLEEEIENDLLELDLNNNI
uniref:Uncharacterized protein n=1 Tax=Acrobeloides nanus TaxID=290746 RepID=A0A914DQ81_9BILA